MFMARYRRCPSNQVLVIYGKFTGSATGTRCLHGGGTSGQCGHPSCVPLTCASQGISCGPAGDGCGGQLDCGTCVAPQTCGGGGVAGACGGIGPVK